MSAVVFLNALALWVVPVKLIISMPYILLTIEVLRMISDITDCCLNLSCSVFCAQVGGKGTGC
jgi:hypothetical protein